MNNIESVLANMANTVAVLVSQRQTSESSVANSDNSLNNFTPLKSSTGSLSSTTSKPQVKKITLEEQIGVAIDPEVIRTEIFSAGYALNDKCQGYCNDDLMRRVAISAALDTVTVKGASGTDLFNDFDIFG
jgi:hypothetical protein